MANVVFPYAMDNIILIPQTATQEIQDKKFVYVLQPDSTLKHTEIQVSNLNDGKNYIVTGGLKEGDKVVVEGVQTLQDGQKIVPITVAQKKLNIRKPSRISVMEISRLLSIDCVRRIMYSYNIIKE